MRSHVAQTRRGPTRKFVKMKTFFKTLHCTSALLRKKNPGFKQKNEHQQNLSSQAHGINISKKIN